MNNPRNALLSRFQRTAIREGCPHHNLGAQLVWALAQTYGGNISRSYACCIDALAQAEYEHGNVTEAVQNAARHSTHKYIVHLFKRLWHDGHLLEAAQLLHIRGRYMSTALKSAYALDCAEKGHFAEALSILRRHAESLCESTQRAVLTTLFQKLPTSTWPNFALVYPFIPHDKRDTLVTQLVHTWWQNGHEMDAVIIAQGPKIPITEALAFATMIAGEYPRWAELITSKHLARTA